LGFPIELPGRPPYEPPLVRFRFGLEVRLIPFRFHLAVNTLNYRLQVLSDIKEPDGTFTRKSVKLWGTQFKNSKLQILNSKKNQNHKLKTQKYNFEFVILSFGFI